MKLSKDFQLKISQVCTKAGIEGLRGDLTCVRSAKALAAFELRTIVRFEDIYQTLPLCLKHRVNKKIYSVENLPNLVEEIFSST